MSRKLAILFAVLAISSIANAAITSSAAAPSGALSVAAGLLFTNTTDAAFTNLTGPCIFTSGFDNTTNFVWCQTLAATTTQVLVYQRRQINATAPATINATQDAKITTSILYNFGSPVLCAGTGYLGIAYSYGAGTTSLQEKPDVSFAFVAVNSTTVTTVKLTASTDATQYYYPEDCVYDNGIFYIIYVGSSSDTTTPNNTLNGVWIHAVNVTSGLAFYNATGGVKLLSPTTQAASTLSGFNFITTNWTGFGSTMGLLTYTDSTGSSATVGSKSIVLPVTLATGAAGSAVTLATGAISTTSVAGTGTTVSISTTVTTTYTVAGGFGSLSTYGVALNKKIETIVLTDPPVSSDGTTNVYSSSAFINGSATASTTFNMTNPTGYWLAMLTGYSTPLGFGLTSYFAPVPSSSATQVMVNKDTYFANGTAILSAVSLGTYDGVSVPQQWQDAAGSPWLGYTLVNTGGLNDNKDLMSGYAGQILQQKLSANALTSIFAAFTLMIVALFAF